MENFKVKRFRTSEEDETLIIGLEHESGLILSITREKLSSISGEWDKESSPFSYHFPQGENEDKMWDYFGSPERMINAIREAFYYTRDNKEDIISFLETGFPPELRKIQRENYNLEELKSLVRKYPAYSQDGKRGKAVVFAKFFFPAGSATWYITEGTVLDEGTPEEDIEFFGYVSGLVPDGDELGYFCLSELRDVHKIGLFIERDSYWIPKTLSEAVPDHPEWWDEEPEKTDKNENE